MKLSWLHTLIFMMGVLLCCSACTSISTPRQSTWGEIITIATAQQSAAPALRVGYVDGASAIFAWIGSDERGVHQDTRTWQSGNLSEAVTLPLPPTVPHEQRLYPASGGYSHLLWRDRDPETDELRLYAALLTPDLIIERGPTPVSNAETFQFAAAPDDRGGLWIAWSGGNPAHPTLNTQYLDRAGRPQQPTTIVRNAEYPTFASSAGGNDLTLFWLQGGQVARASLGDGIPLQTSYITSAAGLQNGDRLNNLSAGRDNDFGYVFWNISRMNGDNETWMATGELNAPYWDQPLQITSQLIAGAEVDVGFHISASPAALGGTPVSWAAPLNGDYTTLPVAAQIGNDLGMLFFSQGKLVAEQFVVSQVTLLAAPAIASDRQNRLYLAWSEMQTDAPADLNFTFTQ
jgi:hypothetical protein